MSVIPPLASASGPVPSGSRRRVSGQRCGADRWCPLGNPRRRPRGAWFRDAIEFEIARVALARFGLAAADARYIAVAFLAQDALDAADRIAFAIEERADAFEKIDIAGPVIAPPAAALQRLDLGKTRFPEAQHVLREVQVFRNLADRPKCFRRLVQHQSPPSHVSGAVSGLILSSPPLQPVNLILHHLTRPEYQDATGGYRNFLASFGIPPDPSALAPDHESAE